MSSLRGRIIRQAAGAAAVMGTYHPAGTPDTPMHMPMVMVHFSDGGAYVEQMVPLVTATGAAVPATAPGRYGQVALAGGGRY